MSANILNTQDIIATRSLSVRDSEGKVVSPVSIHVGKPYQDGQNWSCLYHVVGLESEDIFQVSGIDAFQAIQGAFIVIDGILSGTNAYQQGLLCWEDGTKWESKNP